MRRAYLATMLVLGSGVYAAPTWAQQPDSDASEDETAQPEQASDAEDAAEQRAEGDAAQPAEATEEAPAAAEEDEALQEARERVARAETRFDAGDYDGALQEFKRAYDLLEGHPSRPLLLYNIGKCYEKLFRYDAAMEHYRRYLREAGGEAEDRAEVQVKIEALEDLLGTVILDVDAPQYEVWVDENLVGENNSQVLVPGGSHVVEVRARGYVPARQQVEVAARSETTLRFELEELAEEYRGLDPIYFWSSAALAVATAGAGAVLGLVALNKSKSVDSKLGDEAEQWTVTRSDTQEVKDWALRADILFGVAGAFAVSSVVLAFLTDWGPPGDGASDEEDAGQVSWTVAPAVSPREAGMALRGTF